MKNIVDHKTDGDKLAKFFQKKYGEIVYSGTLAIEVALFSAGIKSGDGVILPGNVCYRILLAVIRSGAKPIIVNPKNGIVLTAGDIALVTKSYKAIILVHSMGIPANVAMIRKLIPKNIVIIEDAAQAWGAKYAGHPIGKHSDFVVTSFGKSKPLSFGIGGAIFSNNKDFKKYLDFNDKPSRTNPDGFFPYVLPITSTIDIAQMISAANAITKKTQALANTLIKQINFGAFSPFNISKDDVASWHRFPIFINNKHEFDRAISLADTNQVVFELPHKMPLCRIPLATQHRCIIINNHDSQCHYRIDLITAANEEKNIRSWIKELKRKK